MGATLSQPFIPLPLRSIKIKSKRPRFRFRLRIRWKRKRTLPEIRALFPNPGHDRREYRESKLYDSSCTEGEERSPLSDSYTFTSASSSAVPTSPVAVAEKAPGALDSFDEPPNAASPSTSSSTSTCSPQQRVLLISKPLPQLPESPLPASVHQVVARGSQETKVLPNNTNNELQPRSQLSQTNDTFLKHTSKPEEDDQETEQDTSSDSDFPPLHRCPNPIISCSDADPDPIRFERPHTPPPWDTSLTGYGSVLEVSRPFRARRVFEHPLVEGHFWGNKGDDSGHYGVGGDLGGGGGPIVTEARRKMWRRLESGKGKGKGNVVNNKDKMKEQHRKIKSKGVEKSQKTINRMSEWRRWKPLPKYPACTGVAQRASTCAAAAAGDKAWIEEVVEEAEDQEYQGGDEKEEEDEEKDEDEEGEDDEDAEDLEEAIKRFLEIKIPVDLNSLRRLRTSFAGTGEHTTTTGSGTGEAAGGEAGEEDLEKAMEGEEGQLSPLVESLMFTDTDIEGFEFLFEEEDEGGGIWDSRIVVGVESGRVDGKGEVCKMNGPTGGFAGGDASRAEVSEEDTGHKVRRAFSATQRLSRWKEKK